MDPALALHRLDQDRRGVRAGRRGQRLDVVQAGEADGGRERLPRRTLGGLAGDGESAVRASVEGVLERDDDRLARGLPRPLQSGLDRLGAGVAEERPRTAEAIGEQAGELQHRLGRVEVGGVPERVELVLRGRERRRMAVAERDDGDAAEQIEVAAPLDVREPDAVAGGERHVVARVRWEQRR